jgi:hypothetical protein
MKYQLVESDEDNYRWDHGWGVGRGSMGTCMLTKIHPAKIVKQDVGYRGVQTPAQA